MEERRGLISRFSSLVRWLLFLLLVSVAAGSRVSAHGDNATGRADSKPHRVAVCMTHYPDLEVKIQSARRVAGKGIEIRGLSISSNVEGTEHRQLVLIDEIFVMCDTDVAELVLRKPSVQQLVIRRMRVQAARYADGSWNVAKLFPPPQTGGALPKIAIEDSSIEMCDLTKSPGGSCAVRSIQLSAQPAAANLGPISARGWHDAMATHFKQVAVKGYFDPNSGNWTAQGTMDGLEMSHRLLGSLPTDVAPYLLGTRHFACPRAHLGFQVSYTQGAEETGHVYGSRSIDRGASGRRSTALPPDRFECRHSLQQPAALDQKRRWSDGAERAAANGYQREVSPAST